MSTGSKHWHAQQPFLKDEALLSINLAGLGQLVKMLITLEPHNDIVYLDQSLHTYNNILTLYSHLYSKR